MRPQKRTYFFRRGTATRCDVRPPLSVFVVVPRLYFQVILVTFCPSSKRRPDEQYLDTPRVVVALTPPARSLLSYLTYCRHWPKIWQKMTQGEYFTDDEGSGDEARPPRPPRSRTRDGEDLRPPRSPTERNDADPIRNLRQCTIVVPSRGAPSTTTKRTSGACASGSGRSRGSSGEGVSS